MPYRHVALAPLFGMLALACSEAGEVSGTDEANASGSSAVAAEDLARRHDAPLDAHFFDANLTPDAVFTRRNPDPTKIDVPALERMLAEAVSQQSDAVIIAYGDTIITEKYYGHPRGPVTIQSITKSVVSLAVGALLDDGKIASLDVPVSTYYPEWGSGDKARVTLRHLLAHTAGIRDDPNGGMFAAPDELAYARAQPLALPPDSYFSYSNQGVMLIGGIVARAASEGADTFVARRFFMPLGITEGTWEKDEAGNVATAGGLFLAPRDLLRLGRLARDQGVWFGQTLVSAAWMTESTGHVSSDPCYGLLWWMLRDGCNSSTGLVGNAGPIEGFFADGWGGNYVTVAPSKAIVAIRTKAPGANQTYEQEQLTEFAAFTHEAPKLAR